MTRLMVPKQINIRWWHYVAICVGSWLIASTTNAQEPKRLDYISTLVGDYCFDCHAGDQAEANLDLEDLVNSPRFSTRFREWEKVAAVVHEKRMPPEDMPQPSDTERADLANAIHSQLNHVANKDAGDPGRVVMRRMTSAEFGYTIQDLTGLNLDFESVLIGDAVGGEGFSNIGDVQFVQDSTLERYLEAAKLVASHAVVGSGPLQFYRSPGKTGLELSAIDRIQKIYRKHGFRIAAGEGGEPFGLDLYPRAFLVCWQFRHRHLIGIPESTLSDLAKDEGLNPRFTRHIWTALNRHEPPFPLSEIAEAWRSLPHPVSSEKDVDQNIREGCQDIASLLRDWQRRLARNKGDDEEAALLTKGSIRLSPKGTFRAVIDWEEGDRLASVHFITSSATGQSVENARVIWRNPQVRFRTQNRARSRPISLVSLLPEDSKQRKLFRDPQHTDHVAGSDLVLAGDKEVQIELQIPDGAISARLSVTAELQSELSPTSIVRCTVKDGSALGDTAANTGEVSNILGLSHGEAFETWATNVLQFSMTLPDVSHREPAPSDRDPIPAPFDNTYNNPERNEFHYSIKYHRDDDFLVRHLIDDVTRADLQHAWNDLLASFDYHDTYLTFVLEKLGGEQGDQKIATLRPDWIATLPDESRTLMQGLVNSYIDTQAALRSAEPTHIDNAIQFAQAAWRRPLTVVETSHLRAFYSQVRDINQLSHVDAIHALLARILVAPEFVYRVERTGSSPDIAPLSQWELASRLSYFLWSSPPDRVLQEIVERGALDEVELQRQTQRMLHDSKSKRFTTEFFGQWFGFYRFDEYRGIDIARFPEFDEQLKKSMHDEANAFFAYLVLNDRPTNEILFADYSFWNQKLAQHYQLPSDRSAQLTSELQRVDDVSPLHRGGLLGLAVVHAATSAPLRTSSVKRGDWILRRVLGTPVPPPPADAGSIPADDVLADGKTVRDRLVAHRREAACVNCHARMDPLGFAMENFDPIGRFRQRYRDGQPIDATGTLHDGTEIDGYEGLHEYLRFQLPKFHRTLCTKLLGYALGRSEILTDRRLIETMMADLKNGEPLSRIATRIVLSPQFRTKRGAFETTSSEGNDDG